MSERGGTEDLSSPPNGPASGSKKPIAEMDRDELVAKCKGLLQIAQKAKVAKDGEKALSFKRYSFFL